MSEPESNIQEVGKLVGHGGWVTALATSQIDNKTLLLSASRDKSLIVWKMNEGQGEEKEYGKMLRRLKGHSHFVQDVAISSDGQFALSGSWDNTLRLWNINTGATRLRFVGHKKDVLSVAFSADNRHIVSGSRDKSINLWNTLGHLKYSMTTNGHEGWVSCVRFSPDPEKPLIVSAGWDKVVKVWGLGNWQLEKNLIGHTAYVNAVTVSPDGSLCASGGKDGTAMLWDLTDGKHLSSLDAGDTIHSLCFSPNRYWLCAATASSVKIWNLESKKVLETLVPEEIKTEKDKPNKSKATPIQCISLAWSPNGNVLFTGYTDNTIRVWQVMQEI
mmetsp:Transcript_6638/g.13067  ORF Transcript_6638/g.13067 Transcript_6638/m.13067 type:complete len:330 (+) Transcript_6638:33-1022(+)|eukprot:CAMPEP_0167782624 /NCGR_PEP_ID=MMETSP0111_2-20121227/6624_1 /TAXON_ID=91324 /ORGANISM="Lotharella globosa, Strain CCCM811" /LENGTH=329 /DNA_ID=CAMNT_0007673483 /DNA_START=32 /DNA_END=1021 /DNA_ORIENTATION=+